MAGRKWTSLALYDAARPPDKAFFEMQLNVSYQVATSTDYVSRPRWYQEECNEYNE
jgi:hypothetical protein